MSQKVEHSYTDQDIQVLDKHTRRLLDRFL